MKNIMRNAALALSVLAGAALVAAPATTAMAKSIQRGGYFGGSIGPRNNYYVKRHHHHYYGPHGRYAYNGPHYNYGPLYWQRPGFSINIR